MNMKSLANEIFLKGKEVFTDMEVYINSNMQTSIDIYEGEVDSYEITESGGISLRGRVGEVVGYAYSENVSADSIDFLIESAHDSAITLTSTDEEFFYNGTEKPLLSAHGSDLDNISTEEKIQKTIAMEKMTRELDDSIVNTAACQFSNFSSTIGIYNTNGLDLEYSDAMGVAGVYIIGKDGNDMYSGGAFQTFYNFADYDSEALAKEAVENTVSKYAPSSVKSNKYDIILKNDAASMLLLAMSSIFSADAVQKKLSLLEGKIGEEIASSVFTLYNDPNYPLSLGNIPFDAEGLPTSKYPLIDAGVLKTYMHNQKTAHKMGVESTGNASRSYKSNIGVAVQNLVVEAGDKSFDELLEEVGNGLLIEELQGLHSGLNAISGDFSLPAGGQLIENGKLVRAVNQITIADNFFDFIRKIDLVGSDIKISQYGVVSPSIIIRDVSVSGE